MDNEYAHKILSAIKKDDVELFARLTQERKGLLSLCFGRLPLLSLVYLYRSVKIAAGFEKTLINIVSYTINEEDAESYRLFSIAARRALRLYVFGKSIVSPLEMLAVLGESERLYRLFEKTEKTEKIENNIVTIYRLLHNQSISYDNGKIVLRRLALSKTVKIAVWALVALACAMIILSGALWGTARTLFGSGEENNPVKIFGEAQLDAAIASGEGYFVLERDITLTTSGEYKDFSGTLSGKGHTVFIQNDALGSLFGTVSGRIEDINFVFADADYILTEDTSLLIDTNNGVIDNVKVSFNGTLSISGDSEELYVSGIASENNGELRDCVFSGVINVLGNGSTDSYLCGIAAVNNGELRGCVIANNSEFSTDTADVAGITIDNGEFGTMDACVNNAAIVQRTERLWYPFAAGIALRNFGIVSECVNNGAVRIEAATTLENNRAAYVGGIVAVNSNRIENCKNSGNVLLETHSIVPYAGGIAGINNGVVSECVNYGIVIIESAITLENDCEAYIGGIVSVNNNRIENCKNSGNVLLETQSIVPYAGGIAGVNNGGIIKCKNEGNVSVDTQAFIIYTGGVAAVNDSYFALIDNCCSYGLITVSAPKTGDVFVFAGGIVGYLFGTVRDSYTAVEFDCVGENVYSGGVIAVAVYNQVTIDNNYYADRANISFGVGAILVINWDNSREVYNGVDENTERVEQEDIPNLEVYWE